MVGSSVNSHVLSMVSKFNSFMLLNISIDLAMICKHSPSCNIFLDSTCQVSIAFGDMMITPRIAYSRPCAIGLLKITKMQTQDVCWNVLILSTWHAMSNISVDSSLAHELLQWQWFWWQYCITNGSNTNLSLKKKDKSIAQKDKSIAQKWHLGFNTVNLLLPVRCLINIKPLDHNCRPWEVIVTYAWKFILYKLHNTVHVYNPHIFVLSYGCGIDSLPSPNTVSNPLMDVFIRDTRGKKISLVAQSTSEWICYS